MIIQYLKILLTIKSVRFVFTFGSLAILNSILVIPGLQELPAYAKNQDIKAERKLFISANTNTKFKTFVEKKTYSIAYPQNWFVTRAENNLAHITNRRMPKTGDGNFPDYLIKTDVHILEESFQSVLSRESASPKEDGDKLIKRVNVKVDGQDAVRLWFTGGETEMLITLLPYKRNKTAYMITFYTKNNSNLLPLIERMHSSFKSLN